MSIVTEDYIRKILMLERRVGATTSYEILSPFSFDSSDAIAIQTAAKRIADFVGLHDIMFIIAAAQQEENIAGNIELQHEHKAAYVEVSSQMKKFPETVLTVLAHEIAHKFLQLKNISCGEGPFYQYENEVLTDITAVYLGLGKVMLNGCEGKTVRQENTASENKIITETVKAGYLDRQQLAFVYLFICAMRSIPSNLYEKNLSSESIESLRKCKEQYGYSFDSRFSMPMVRDDILKRANNAIRQTQSQLSSVDKNLSFLQNVGVNSIETFLQQAHKKLMQLMTEIHADTGQNEPDPCIRFINTLEMDQKVMQITSATGEISALTEKYLRATSELTNLMQNIGAPFSPPEPETFCTVVCRNDGTKIKLPAGKSRLEVKCPKCHYDFIADTSLPTCESAIPEEVQKPKKSFLHALKKK